MKKRHVVFYDGECPLCNFTVRTLLSLDKKACFLFAPLQGETANRLHLSNESMDTMVLLENYQEEEQYLFRGKAALRICWYLGGLWAFLGSLSFLPSFPFDLFYRLVARNRYRLFSSFEEIDQEAVQDRFLP